MTKDLNDAAPIMLREITLYRVRLPLITPYRLSYHTFQAFEPIIVELRDQTGRIGWGEGHISPGSSAETQDGGWAYAKQQAERLPGLSTGAAKAAIANTLAHSPVAATALITAIEMLEDHRLLQVGAPVRWPLLTAFNALEGDAIPQEVDQRLAQGFKTFKIKVGQDVAADLARVAVIQRTTAGRASLRIDANRGYSRSDGIAFASSLDPAGIELFEQPCAAEDWAANGAVAAASTVPLMLDEPICALADIDRAAPMDGVGYCKLKLKRFGGLDRLHQALCHVRELAMEPVLGDGLGGEISCWMEAAVARDTIRNAGEFNGYLKPKMPLLANPLGFEDGALVMPAGYRPEVDRDRLAVHTLAQERFGPRVTGPGPSIS
jgi:L-alanine-DL-glutamate epimerase-like enolase superfamily enzyme